MGLEKSRLSVSFSDRFFPRFGCRVDSVLSGGCRLLLPLGNLLWQEALLNTQNTSSF
jgi:hypothetical protein